MRAAPGTKPKSTAAPKPAAAAAAIADGDDASLQAGTLSRSAPGTIVAPLLNNILVHHVVADVSRHTWSNLTPATLSTWEQRWISLLASISSLVGSEQSSAGTMLLFTCQQSQTMHVSDKCDQSLTGW